MAAPIHLDVSDVMGERVVMVGRSPFTIGRRETNDLQLSGSEVSREHAAISVDGETWILHDCGSRLGTFVNDEETVERVLNHGDRIRLGQGGGAELVFAVGDLASTVSSRSGSDPVGDLQVLSALLDGLRAIRPGRVLDEVLALVLDSAIAITGAERGVIMLNSADCELEVRLARANGRMTLDSTTFHVSQQIPKHACATGQTQVVTDLLASGLASRHADTVAHEIRSVLCAPLHSVRVVEAAESCCQDRCFGVLYLDSQRKGSFLSDTVRSGLETLADQASVAIENARLYREAAANAEAEREMRLAARIQALLLPTVVIDKPFVEAAAVSLPCRSIGGDFFDYANEDEHRLAFTLGDVAGKGPPAALLSALTQGMCSVATEGSDAPAVVVSRVNAGLRRRDVEARFLTLFHGVLDPSGRLVYCNAGHNPPVVFGPSGVRRLTDGGPIVGILDSATYDDGCVQLAPGDRIVVFSDGVSEALNQGDEEFGDARLLALLDSVNAGSAELDAPGLIDSIIAAVRGFTRGAPQSDDITAMVVRYRGPTNR